MQHNPVRLGKLIGSGVFADPKDASILDRLEFYDEGFSLRIKPRKLLGLIDLGGGIPVYRDFLRMFVCFRESRGANHGIILESPQS